ncbi:hypothetical protein [uncultured Maribacter sp.]|uniref:Rieske (2Fe-2S) protein n=1 Tax=uncultured Maribacter sp. TaxID=431308 RepID=UPI002611482D|nr:hypothetical protein [uncultured Maribacter sp.]
MKYIFSFFILSILFSCSSDRGIRNPYLQDIGFRIDINLNLPQYSDLTNVGNAVPVNINGVGTKGVFVINTGFDQYRAFEASCPNHAPNECSKMVIDGQVATCSCEEYTYNLFTGQLSNSPNDGGRYYNMLEYRATGSGNIVVISN